MIVAARVPAREERKRLSLMLEAVGCPDLARMAMTVHPGNPVPQERAGGRGTRRYTPKRSRDAQESVARSLLALKARGPWQGNLALACIFYRATRHVVDEDNLAKLLKDAGTHAGVWRDDSQITGAAYVIELDRENPRTVIALADHQSSLRRDLVRVK